jgi:type II secretory pathway predicted ATPase ExeA
MQEQMTEHSDFDLQETSFSNVAASQDLFVGVEQQSVMEAIQNCLASRQGMIALIGASGLGKTTLVRAVLSQMESPQLTPIYIDQPNLDSDAFAVHIAQALGEDCSENLAPEKFPDPLTLFEPANLGAHRIVLVVDDAHLMPMPTLHQVGQLGIHAAASVQVILIGQTVLTDSCECSGLSQHTTTIELNPLTPKESEAYISAYLARTSIGQQADILSAGAMKAIVKYALGTPRALNMVCTDVLRAGFSKQERPITAKTAQRVIAEFNGLAPKRRFSLTWAGALAAGAIIGWVSLFLLTSKLDRVGSMPTVAAAHEAPSPRLDLPDMTVTQLSMSQHVPEASAPLPGRPQPEPLKIVPPQIASPSMMKQEAPAPSPNDALAQVTALLNEAFPTGGDFNLQLWLDKDSGRPYEEGETLGISLQASSDAYLRIDYYQADGQVLHLLPNPLGVNRVKAGEPFVFGTLTSHVPLVVGPPFGEEMLIVIASQQAIPLPADAALVESSQHYISQLTHDLQRIKEGKAAIVFMRLSTQPRGEG